MPKQNQILWVTTEAVQPFGWSFFLTFVSRRSLALRSAPSVNPACAALRGAYPKIAPCSLPRPSGLRSAPETVMQISIETGRQFVRARQAEGAGNAVINRSLACLRYMLRLAHEERKLAYVPKIRFLKEPPARTGTVSEEKFDELLKALPTHLRPLICFLYWTGVR